MTIRRSIDPCPSSSRPQRLFATASGTGGPPTQRRWRAIRGTSCSRAPGRAGRDELQQGPARHALRLAQSRDDGERRTGKGGGARQAKGSVELQSGLASNIQGGLGLCLCTPGSPPSPSTPGQLRPLSNVDGGCRWASGSARDSPGRVPGPPVARAPCSLLHVYVDSRGATI